MQEKLKQTGKTNTCPCAVIVRDGKILKGFRHYSPKLSRWISPGGRCEKGETIEQALLREIKEEVNITDIKIADFIGEVKGASEGDVVPIFFCTTEQDFELMEPEKFSEWKWVPIEEYLRGNEWAQMNSASHKLVSEYLLKRRLV